MSTPKKELNPKIELKKVKIVFTDVEFKEMGQQLADLHNKLTNVILEEKAVSKKYKSTRGELEAKIASVSTDVSNGFELRDENCVVIMFPKERRKRFWLCGQDPKKVPFILEEEMTNDDFQQDLIDVPVKFEKGESIELFPKAGEDYATLMVATARKLWYATVCAKVGEKMMTEEMTIKTPAAKKRYDAICRAAKRYEKWLAKELGKDAAKGFVGPLQAAVELHRERAE